MLNNKFLIFINRDFEPIIALAKVTYHKEIHEFPEFGNVIARDGGGWWSLNNGILRLYESSEDFGKYNIEQAKEAFENKRVFYFDDNLFEDEAWNCKTLVTE